MGPQSICNSQLVHQVSRCCKYPSPSMFAAAVRPGRLRKRKHAEPLVRRSLSAHHGNTLVSIQYLLERTDVGALVSCAEFQNTWSILLYMTPRYSIWSPSPSPSLAMHLGVPLLSSLFLALILVNESSAHNSTILNPILPGFHPDPSCIFVPEWNNTFFCASSSFEAFPGIPIHASKDLQHWKHVSNVLSRVEQLPDLAITNRSTSGIWAPALRYHKGTFWMMTTLVHDERPADDDGRWDNVSWSTSSQDPSRFRNLLG